MDRDAMGEPTTSAELCAVALVCWQVWYEQMDIPRELLTMQHPDGPINLATATETALAAFRHQHGKPGIDASEN
jgi:hypothetical protein